MFRRACCACPYMFLSHIIQLILSDLSCLLFDVNITHTAILATCLLKSTEMPYHNGFFHPSVLTLSESVILNGFDCDSPDRAVCEGNMSDMCQESILPYTELFSSSIKSYWMEGRGGRKIYFQLKDSD